MPDSTHDARCWTCRTDFCWADAEPAAGRKDDATALRARCPNPSCGAINFEVHARDRFRFGPTRVNRFEMR